MRRLIYVIVCIGLYRPSSGRSPHTCTKGPSQKYLEANEVKYFSLGGEGVGDFMVTISLLRGGRGSREK